MSSVHPEELEALLQPVYALGIRLSTLDVHAHTYAYGIFKPVSLNELFKSGTIVFPNSLI